MRPQVGGYTYCPMVTYDVYKYSIECIALAVPLICLYISKCYGLAVASPYVGMAQKQDGSSNQCISVYTVM